MHQNFTPLSNIKQQTLDFYFCMKDSNIRLMTVNLFWKINTQVETFEAVMS